MGVRAAERGTRGAKNLDFVRPLYDRGGPWASDYLDADRAVENADHEVGLRRRAARAELEEQGCDPATADLAEVVNAEVIVVVGDVRAVQFVVEKLPARWRDRVVRTDAGESVAATSARLVLVRPEEADLPHGIAATLRYADGDTAAP